MTVMTSLETKAGSAVGCVGPNIENEQIGNAVTQHLVGNERPAENDSEQEKVEIEIAEVGQARPAPYDVSGE